MKVQIGDREYLVEWESAIVLSVRFNGPYVAVLVDQHWAQMRPEGVPAWAFRRQTTCLIRELTAPRHGDIAPLVAHGVAMQNWRDRDSRYQGEKVALQKAVRGHWTRGPHFEVREAFWRAFECLHRNQPVAETTGRFAGAR